MKEIGLLIVVLFVISHMDYVHMVSSSDEGQEEDNLDRYLKNSKIHHNRQKRQTLVGGGNACAQTFIVPKTAVMCELSPQVQGEMTSLRENFENHVTELEQLKVMIDNLNPDKPRPLPDEVRERLATIIMVREAQAGLKEALDRIDTDIGQLGSRIDQIEAADRQEVARLIEQQTQLIKVTLHQSNMTLHDEYVDRLTESTRHLTDKLRELQDELNDKVVTSEERLKEALKAAEIKGQKQLDDIKKELFSKAEQLKEELSQESAVRQQYQIQTVGNKGELEKLMDLITTLREHQAQYEQDKNKLRGIVSHLQDDLKKETAAKEELISLTQHLNSSLAEVVMQYNELKEEVKECNNKSTVLENDLQSLTQSASDNDHLLPRLLKVSNCHDALQFFQPASGVYAINPGLATEPFDVFCDMEDGQGWTVLQRRSTGKTDFYRNWNAYKNGFGDLDDEHWLGLERIYALTNGKKYKLRVDIQDWKNKWWFAEYDKFSIDGEVDAYKLHVSEYHGNAGDAMRYHDGMGFSTHDRNNDKNDGICARWCRGAWWYRDCFQSNLNGRYYNTGPYTSKTGWGDGVVWRTLKNTNFYSLKAVTMKIRPSVDK